MLNIGKYKILAALTGTGAGAYGSYELYNNFGPGGKSGASVASSGNGEEVEAPVLDVNGPSEPAAALQEEVESQEENEDEEREEPVEEQEVVEAKEEEQVEKPKEEVKVEVVREKPVPAPEARPAVQVKRTQKKPTYNFYDSDGHSIKIIPGTQGQKFKDSLITDTRDAESWSKKVTALNADLDYQAERDRENKGHINALPQEFKVDKNKHKDYITQELQKRCYNAYKKKSWNDLTTQGRPPITNERMRQYWTMVWKFCGKPTIQNTPEGWYIG